MKPILALAGAWLVLLLLGCWLYIRLSRRLRRAETMLRHLVTFGQDFPEFLRLGEDVSRTITEELDLKQETLKKLIGAAGDASKKLDYLEQKVKEKKLNRETIDEILILINQGFALEDISSRLNLPLGEIELVVNLRRYLRQPQREKL